MACLRELEGTRLTKQAVIQTNLNYKVTQLFGVEGGTHVSLLEDETAKKTKKTACIKWMGPKRAGATPAERIMVRAVSTAVLALTAALCTADSCSLHLRYLPA